MVSALFQTDIFILVRSNTTGDGGNAMLLGSSRVLKVLEMLEDCDNICSIYWKRHLCSATILAKNELIVIRNFSTWVIF